MTKLISSSATYQWLEHGKRLHLQHGPIDLIVEAVGDDASVEAAYRQAHEAFKTVLDDLVDELSFLREPMGASSVKPKGRVALRMVSAAAPYSDWTFVTPMIAVAGSVADHVLQAMLHECKLSRAYVNNGGDIALWLADGESFTIGICENTETGEIGSRVSLWADDAVQGVATSGWRGRSHSLGIADAVTVLARNAAMADAAATIIANAVDVPRSTRIHRLPAVELSPDSDLGDTLVTVAVEQLESEDVEFALENGSEVAQDLLGMGLIDSAYLSLQGSSRVCSRQTVCQRVIAGAMHA